MTAKERRLLNTLYISGSALIAFGILVVVKFAVEWGTEEMYILLIQMFLEVNPPLAIVFISLTAGVMILEFFLCLYIGLSAKADSRDKKKGIFYIVVAFIMMAIMIVSVALTIFLIITSPFEVFYLLENLVYIGVGITVIFCLLQIITSSIKKRKLHKKGVV